MTSTEKTWMGLAFGTLFATAPLHPDIIGAVIQIGFAVGWLGYGLYHGFWK